MPPEGDGIRRSAPPDERRSARSAEPAAREPAARAKGGTWREAASRLLGRWQRPAARAASEEPAPREASSFRPPRAARFTRDASGRVVALDAGGAARREAAAEGARRRLADPEAAVEAALAQAGRDPRVALAALESLERRAAPSAVVLHALALAQHATGNTERALSTARRALPLCFRERRGLLAADLLAELDADAHALGFSREQLVALGGALAEGPAWETGFRALASSLMKSPADERVAAALIALAERLAAHGGSAEPAWKVLQFLAVVAGEGPHGPTIRRLLDELEARPGSM